MLWFITSGALPSRCFAKPIIDILVVVKNLNLVDEQACALESIGYEAKGEFGIHRDGTSGKRTRNASVHITFMHTKLETSKLRGI